MVRYSTGHQIARGISDLSSALLTFFDPESEPPTSTSDDELRRAPSESHGKSPSRPRAQEVSETGTCISETGTSSPSKEPKQPLRESNEKPFDFLFGMQPESNGAWTENRSKAAPRSPSDPKQGLIGHISPQDELKERIQSSNEKAQQADLRELKAREDIRLNTLRRHALMIWLVDPATKGLLLRAVLCAWSETVIAQRALVSRKRYNARASPECQVMMPSPAPSPAPVLRALVAFSSATDESFVYGCFCAWRGTAQDMKRRKASMAWCLERMALSQTGLLEQAIFRSWYHLATQSRKPAWALSLQREMQDLMRYQKMQNDDSSNAVPNLSSSQSKLHGAELHDQNLLRTIFLAVACLLLGYFFSALYFHSNKSVASNAGSVSDITMPDSDSDGIADQVDRCPLTAQHYQFRSSWQTDWDGDGCMDSVEDLDDDNDLVINSKDLCPRSLNSDGSVDQDGCTRRQRDLYGTQSNLSVYGYKVSDTLFEVTVGFLFTTSISYLWSCRSEVTSRLQALLASCNVWRSKSR
mmetsp:Transcript_85448/g.151090  ORF Transcript_85448/g.151090 Transcript_85448/m.151090 type:complete len:527 (+) Transcript_85448:34-1614(+)